MIECVIFDLDDTLFEEIEYCKSGFREISARLAKQTNVAASDEIYEALWNEFKQGKSGTIFNAVLDQFNLNYDHKFIVNLVKIYRDHLPTIALPEDSRKILDHLRNHFKIALLSDGFLPAQRLKIQALEIQNYFECIVLTEELGRDFWKPSPLGFKKIIKDLNVCCNKCVYIGDNLTKDFIAPNQLGFRTIQLIRQHKLHNSPPPNADAEPEFVINSMYELPSLLKKL